MDSHPKEKFISLWDIPAFLAKNKVSFVEEGEKHVCLEEKIETLRTSSEALSKEFAVGEVNSTESFNCATAPGVTFASAAERNLHYKTDWHRWNLKLRSAGLTPITLDEFNELNRVGEMSSSEEEGEEKDEAETEHAVFGRKGSAQVDFITESQKKISVWKNVVIPVPNQKYIDLKIFIDGLNELPKKTNWVILMSSGGKFAGGVFEKSKCVKHKTFHKYVVRKKQGGTQSSRDKCGNAPRSVGATIRRENETKFKEQVSEILVNWRPYIQEAHLIFIYAPGLSWLHFFTAGELKKDDPRIRSVPIPVRSPTLLEVKHVHSWLCSAEISNYVAPEKKAQPSTNEPNETISQPFEVSDEDPIKSEDKISDAIKANDLPTLVLLLEQDYEPIIDPSVTDFFPALYLAVSCGGILKLLNFY